MKLGEPICVVCMSYAARRCDLCGTLCVDHICEHLSSVLPGDIELTEEVGDSTASAVEGNNSGSYRTIESSESAGRNWLSDAVMIAGMTDAQLKTALARYKDITRTIETELRFRLENPATRRARRVYSPIKGDQASARTGKPRSARSGQRKELKKRIDMLLSALQSGLVTKETIEQMLQKNKGKSNVDSAK